MSEKRFLLDKVKNSNAILSVKITDSVSDDDYFIMTKDFYEDDIDEIVDVLNEQQATINHLKQELEEYKENWEDMVKLATKTSLRNVELDEQIGRLQRENEQLKKARDKSDKFIVKKGLEIEFLEWCINE